MARSRRPPSHATVREAAESLKRLLHAVEAGEVVVSTPRDVALLRLLQGTQAGWEEVLGKESKKDGHSQ